MFRHSKIQKKSSHHFKLENKDFGIIGGLFVSCILISLYIGFAVGQSTRLPEQFNQVVKQFEPPQTKKVDENSFAVFNLKNSPAENAVANKVNSIEKELDEQEKQQQKTAAPADENLQKEVAKPENANNEKIYAIQVIAISDLDRANNYVKLLRDRNFDSYLQTISDGNNNQIYRVRVGQTPLSEAEKTLEELKPLLEGLNPTIVEIKP